MEIFILACLILTGGVASKQKPKVVFDNKGKVLRDNRVVKPIESSFNYVDSFNLKSVDYVRFYR